jgi:hypothetical protein
LCTQSITRQRPLAEVVGGHPHAPAAAAGSKRLDVRLPAPGRRARARRLEAPLGRLVALADALQEAHLAGQHRVAVGVGDALHAQLVERAGRALA